MFSAGKCSSFKYLLVSSSVSLLLLVFNSAQAATTLTITQTDNGIGTKLQTYTSTTAVAVTIQNTNQIQFMANSAIPKIWSAAFNAPQIKQLEVTNYEDAALPQGYPNSTISPTKPGMNISIGGQQCAAISGRFDVLEVSYDSQGVLLSLAVDFVQQCGSNPTPLRGSIRHNTPLLPAITIKPIAIAGADQYVVELNIVDLNLVPVKTNGNQIKLNALNSSAGDGLMITGYSWKQVSGPVVTLSNNVSPAPVFTLPEIKLGGDELVFEVTITNTNGVVNSDLVTIYVASKSDPQTSFFFESDPTDIIGKGKRLYADSDDANFIVKTTDNDHAHISIDNGSNWSTSFSAIAGSGGLIIDIYNGVKRHPVSLATDPGLYVRDKTSSCTNVTGNFDIKQIKRDAKNNINNLYIEFVQECDQLNSPTPQALRGNIKINYIDKKVPTAHAGAAQTVTEATLVFLDASNSIDADGNIDKFEWTQLSGTLVTLSDNLISNPTFIAPDFASSSNEDLVFQVTVTDNKKFKAKSTVNIKISKKVTTPPVVQPQGKDSSAVGGGGGGCSFNNNARFDASFYLMILFLLFIQIIRRQVNLK